MKKSAWLFLVAGALLGALAFTACGDDDDNEDTAGSETPAATTKAADASTGTPAAATAGNDETPLPGGGATVNVQTKDFAFDPAEITVPAAEPITFKFTNADSTAHTFTLYIDEEFTHAIDGGSASESTPEITVAFVAPGDYYFRCEIHKSQMQGKLKAE